MWHYLKLAYISILTAVLFYSFYPQLHHCFTNRQKNMLSYLLSLCVKPVCSLTIILQPNVFIVILLACM